MFITLEGGEGSGKTTQIQLLASHLRKEGHPVTTTREPGGTRISDAIREILLDPTTSEMDDRTEALLYAASRAQLVAEVIKKDLDSGKIVICDRYIDSSIAYQVFARGLKRETIEDISNWAVDGLWPDITFYLRVSPKHGLSRATGESDRIQKEELEFHDQVASGYEELALENPDRIKVIEAISDIDEIHGQIAKIVDLQLLDRKV